MNQFDAPISGLSEDQLNRREFSSLIAKSIRNIDVRGGSFTVAITGDWGEGKTSVMNMIVQWLLHDEMSSASGRGIYFSSLSAEWNHEQVTQAQKDYRLVSAYADVQHLHNKTLELSDVRWLERTFQQITKDELKAKNALQYFKLRHYCMNHPKVLVFRFSPWVVTKKEQIALNFVSELAKALNGKCGIEVDREIEAVRNRIVTLLQVAGAAGDIYTGTSAGSFISHLLAKSAKHGSSELETLDGLMERLSTALFNAPQLEKVLVVIDDLDRLSPAEVVEMLSVIKGIANLPKTVHLLGYAESELASRIKRQLGIDGNQFLEKIVQQKFALSQVPLGSLEEVVFSGIERQSSNENTIQADGFENAWRDVVRNYVQTMRDAKRVNNSFLFAHSALSKITFAPDLLVVETLKMCEPDIYNWLRTKLDRQIEESQNLGTFNNKVPREEYLEQKIAELSLKQGREFALRALSYLMPETGFNPVRNSYRRKTGSVDRPFHELDYRPNYFVLSAVGQAWSRDDLDTSATESIAQKIDRLLAEIQKQPTERQSGLRATLLSEIDDLLERNEWDNQETFVALNAKAPELIRQGDMNTSWYMSNNRDRLRGMLIRILTRALEVDRAKIFQAALTSSNDISLICDVARSSFVDKNSDGKQLGEINFGQESETLYQALLDRVAGLANSRKIWAQANPGSIFWFWRFAVGIEDPKRLILDSLNSAVDRASVYELFLSQILSSNRGLYERISKKSISTIIEPDTLYGLATKDLDSTDISLAENAKRFVTAFDEYDASID
jgi:predicted KAP-like P-loop ATPase